MRLTMGVYAATDQVVAGLVDMQFPQLGTLDARTVAVGTGTSTAVSDAVAASIGIMRVRAMQNDLQVEAACIVCEDPAQVELIRSALTAQMIDDVAVVDGTDSRLDSRFEREVAAAVLAAQLPATSSAKPEPVAATPHRRVSPLVMLAAGVFLLLIAGGAAWSLTAQVGGKSSAEDITTVGDASAAPTVRPSSAAGSAGVSVPAAAIASSLSPAGPGVAAPYSAAPFAVYPNVAVPESAVPPVDPVAASGGGAGAPSVPSVPYARPAEVRVAAPPVPRGGTKPPPNSTPSTPSSVETAEPPVTTTEEPTESSESPVPDTSGENDGSVSRATNNSDMN